MDKNVYIIGDIVVTFTEEEYKASFSEEQIVSLENDETVEWIDEEGMDHTVRLISN